MATCAECGAVKLIERSCPKCGRMNNVGNPKPFTDAEKLSNLARGLIETAVPFVGYPRKPKA